MRHNQTDRAGVWERGGPCHVRLAPLRAAKAHSEGISWWQGESEGMAETVSTTSALHLLNQAQTRSTKPVRTSSQLGYAGKTSREVSREVQPASRSRRSPAHEAGCLGRPIRHEVRTGIRLFC